jgi:hypothetical protein
MMGKHCISPPSSRCSSFPHFELAHPETCNSIMCTHPPKAGVPSAVWKSVLRSRTKASTAAHQKTPSALANSTPPFSPSGPKQLHGDYAIPARRGGQALLLMGRPALPGDGNMETGRGRTTCQRCTMHDTTAPRRLCIVSFFKPSFSCRRLLLPPPVPVFPLPPSLLSPIAPPTISSHHDAAANGRW